MSSAPVWEIAFHYPPQGEWTEADYLALDTNRLVELSEGFLEFPLMPTVLHQLIVAYVYDLLNAFVRAHVEGRVFFAPLPVRLWAGKYREPDILYVRPERIGNLRGQPYGADLAMEVVSDSEEDRKRDLIIKREEYARAGIREYWIIDPQQQSITVLVLDGEIYREHGIFARGMQATSVLLNGFSVLVEAVFAVGQQTDVPPGNGNC
ncbi:MAG TPA: Uma2 family endonuclease [Gemmataceae bacterium]|nr:Uma2 family endonuclease [Gemmataceae bacterium]